MTTYKNLSLEHTYTSPDSKVLSPPLPPSRAWPVAAGRSEPVSSPPRWSPTAASVATSLLQTPAVADPLCFSPHTLARPPSGLCASSALSLLYTGLPRFAFLPHTGLTSVTRSNSDSRRLQTSPPDPFLRPTAQRASPLGYPPSVSAAPTLLTRDGSHLFTCAACDRWPRGQARCQLPRQHPHTVSSVRTVFAPRSGEPRATNGSIPLWSRRKTLESRHLDLHAGSAYPLGKLLDSVSLSANEPRVLTTDGSDT